MKRVFAYILRAERDIIEVICNHCQGDTHYWLKINGVMIANLVNKDSLYEAEQLYKAINYPL